MNQNKIIAIYVSNLNEGWYMAIYYETESILNRIDIYENGDGHLFDPKILNRDLKNHGMSLDYFKVPYSVQYE